MDEKNQEVEVEETLDLPETEEGEEDTTDWKAEATKLRDKAIAQRERTKTLKQQLKDKETAIATLAGTKKAEPTKTGELDDAVLDFFDLKGYDADQVKVFQQIMQKTGMSHREVIKDDYALAKVKSIQEEREVKAATPSGTKRGGGQVGDVASAIAKYESTGVLPDDFALRSAVVNKMEEKRSVSVPSWQR